MKLPEEYTKKMRSLLDESEFEQFMRSYDEARYYGLRVNTLKISVDEFLRISPYKLEKVPWAKDGFYYEEGENPGRHPYYHAGLYYIQEPSAMLPGEVIDARPGERVLDLCAAPGGKTGVAPRHPVPFSPFFTCLPSWWINTAAPATRTP